MKTLEEIKGMIIDVPNFPKAGIVFKDITPVLADHASFKSLCMHFAEQVPKNTTKIVAIESRGFLLGAALSQHLHLGLVLVRKPGKLPRKAHKVSYDLEYGSDSLELHEADLGSQDKVVIIDDVLATGGTARATEDLVNRTGAEILKHIFLMEIDFLKGSKKLIAPSKALFQV